MKRNKVSNRGSRKLFTATAKKSHPKNFMDAIPMRGGIRL